MIELAKMLGLRANGVFPLQDMELKGQMMFLQESDSMMFLGSPSVEKLEELIGKGIYISDIPIHDATRDVILVGEQTKAQVFISLAYHF